MRTKDARITAFLFVLLPIVLVPLSENNLGIVSSATQSPSSYDPTSAGSQTMSFVPDLTPDFAGPIAWENQEGKPQVFLFTVDRLVELYLFRTGMMPPKEVRLSLLTSLFSGWVPVFLPVNSYTLEDRILFSTGIIDRDLLDRVKKEILATGFNPEIQNSKSGYVAFFRDLIPAHYPAGRLIIDWSTGEIVLYPMMDLETELNIAAFRWRLYHVVNEQRYLMGDWPVIVGKPSTKTPVAWLLMDQMERYPHWRDPETGRYVGPGPRNPLGVWKLKSSFSRRLWYYHGTNMPSLIGRPHRALSHGCIRNDNDNIRRLAWLLVSHNAGMEAQPGYATGVFDILGLLRNRIVPLLRAVLAKNLYDTIEVEVQSPLEESLVNFYPNIYWVQHEDHFYRLTTVDHLEHDLAKIGLSSATLDMPRLNEVVERMQRVRALTAVPVKTLLLAAEPEQAPN